MEEIKKNMLIAIIILLEILTIILWYKIGYNAREKEFKDATIIYSQNNEPVLSVQKRGNEEFVAIIFNRKYLQIIENK